MKVTNNEEMYEEVIEYERVNDRGDSNDWTLCLDGESLSSIFWKYRMSNVRVKIQVLPNED